MVEVICDTSFLIHIATKRIKNIDNLNMEIGTLDFVVPTVVKNELKKLLKTPSKKDEISLTLNFIENLKSFNLVGTFADKKLIDFASRNHVIIATLDKKLKKEIKQQGCSIISIHNEKIILEN